MGTISEKLQLVDAFSQTFGRFISLGNRSAATTNAISSGLKRVGDSSSGIRRAGTNVSYLSQALETQRSTTARLRAEHMALLSSENAKAGALKKSTSALLASTQAEQRYTDAIQRATLAERKFETQSRLVEAQLAQKEAQITRLKNSIDQYNSSNTNATNGMSRLAGSARILKATIGAVVGSKILGDLTSMSDGYVTARARMNQMNDGLQTTDELYRMVYQSANRSRASMGATSQMVGMLGTTAKESFGSMGEIVSFTEQLNKHLRLSGANTETANAAMLQITQAMGSGVLRGDELNTVMEAIPTAAQSIAKYMGVSVAEMRELAADGKITSDVLKNALLSSAQQTNEQFESIPITFSQAMTMVGNGMQQALLPLLQAISSGIQFVSKNWETISPILLGVATAAGIVATAMGIQAAMTYFASAAFKSLAMAILTNPLTYIAIVIGAVVAAIYWWIQSVGGIRVAWLIVVNAVLTAWDALKIGFMTGVYAVQNWLDAMSYKFHAISASIANAVGDMKVMVLQNIENMVNGAISLLNDFINAVNKIPGVALSTVDKVSFAASAAASNEAAKSRRNAELGALQALNARNSAERAANLNAMKAQATANALERLSGIAAAREEAKASGDNGFGGGGETPPYSPGGDVNNVGTVGKVKKLEGDVKLSDEDLRIYRDLAERRYMNQIELKTLAPNINVTLPAGASGNFSAQDVADHIKKMLIQEMAASTAVPH